MAETTEKKKLHDFAVIKVLIDRGIGVRGNMHVLEVEQAKRKNKNGHVKFELENEHCQTLMHSMVHNTQKVMPIMLLVDMDEFNKVKAELEAGPSPEELAFNAGRERIKHPDFDYVYETFEEYQQNDRKGNYICDLCRYDCRQRVSSLLLLF